MKNILMGLLLIISTSVLATDPHHEPIDYTITNTTNMIEDNSAIAAAMGGHHFDYGTYAEQKSVTFATIDGSPAFSGAFAIRDCKECGLFSVAGAVGRVNHKNKVGVVAGYTWSY